MEEKILVSEPNLQNHSLIKLHPTEQVRLESDLLIFLVAHDEFRNLDLTGKEVFDLVESPKINEKIFNNNIRYRVLPSCSSHQI